MDEATVDVAAVLADKLTEVDAQIAELTQPLAEAGDIGFGKRVGDGTSIAVERITQVAAHDRLLAVRDEVLRAQAKLAAGTYGLCDRCGKPIPAGRLEALPWATAHVDCDSA
jgi:DnaK suppressor protein